MIKIHKNPNGDTRTASKNVTFEEFQKANDLHRRDVALAIEYLADELKGKMFFHDRTKVLLEELFYQDFKKTLDTGADFTKGEWYKIHIRKERHHPISYLHKDYNLLDLLETICDCVCAGLARSGEVRPMEFDDKILKLAVMNTIKLLQKQMEVVNDD